MLYVVFGTGRHRSAAEPLDHSRQRDDRIGDAKVAPGMSARASDRDLVTAAAQPLVDDGVDPAPSIASA